MKKNIAVTMGGFSSEAGISFKSGDTVVKNLDKKKYNVFSILINKERWYCLENNIDINKNDFSLTMEGKKIIFDAVYNTIHGTPGEDGKFQGYLEMIGIPHSSCLSFESAITFGKIESKAVLSKFNIPSAPMIGTMNNVKVDDSFIKKVESDFGFPCFVKPNRSGSSFGVSKVYNKEELENAIKKASEEDNKILIEKFVSGVEISVGITKIDNSLKILGITEIISENDFFDYEAKYEGLSKDITPARLDEKTVIAVENITKDIYKILDLRGICRIDYIVENNIPHFLEVNTTPGLSEWSIIPQQAKYSNISLQKLFDNEIKKILE